MKENGSTSPFPRVTVMIPVRNSPKFLADCLDSLLPQDYPDYEVIVIDDGSSDNTAEVAKRYPVRLISSPRLGISSARNQAIRAARGEIVMTTDADLIVPRDLIRRLVAPLQDPGVGVTLAWWGIRNRENMVAALIYRVYEYIVRNITDADFFWGYCVAFRKSLVDEVGYFDETIPFVEDLDFAYRVIRTGRRIRLLKDVRVLHYFRDSLSIHLKRHYKTARSKFREVHEKKKFIDQRATLAEYVKILLHFAALLSLAALPWKPLITLGCFALALLSHLPMTVWGMRAGAKYILLLPFEFLTKMAWTLGVIQGAWWLLKGYIPPPREVQ
ncbi:MAG: glycosyltransferase [Candidatus Aureabacteria bacterium]|nr:glycosyltransferase [Candidatus Auribacterota bacterium]